MATPLVASRQNQRRPSLSPSQAPSRNFNYQPTSSHNFLTPIIPTMAASFLGSRYSSPGNDRLAVYNTSSTFPASSMQTMAPHHQAFTMPQPPYMLLHMLGSADGRNDHSTRSFRGNLGIHSTGPMFSNLPSSSSASNFLSESGQILLGSLQSWTSTAPNHDYLPAVVTAATSTGMETVQMSPSSAGLETVPAEFTQSAEVLSPSADLSTSFYNYPTQATDSHPTPDNVTAFQPSKQPVATNTRKRKMKTPPPCQEEDDSYQICPVKPKYSTPFSNGKFEVWKPLGRPRKPKSPQERKRIARTRQAGACKYHQKRRKACNSAWRPYVECLDVPPQSFVFLMKPEQIALFRPRPVQGHPLLQREAVFQLQEVSSLQPWEPGLQQLILTQGLGKYLDVYVMPFTPGPGDKKDHLWFKQGQRMTIGMPNYCIGPIQRARQSLAQYIPQSSRIYLRHVFKNSGNIVQEVLLYASQYANQSKSSLVTGALRLLATNRMIERDWEMTGMSTLGIQPVVENDCPWYGKVPITPMMDTQLDQIVIQDHLIPMGKQMLSELQEKMYDESKENLFDIFLVVFILATNLEWLLRHSRNNAKRYNARRRYNSLGLQQSYIQGHNVLLSHFHHLTRGSDVAAATSEASTSSGSGLSEDQLNFMAKIRQMMTTQKEHLQRIRQAKQYETELYWSHQIFLTDWEPESTEIADEVMTC